MIAQPASGMPGSPRRPRLVVALLLALAGGGFGIRAVSHAVQAASHARAAEAYLEQSEHRQWRANLTHARDELIRCRRISPGNVRFCFLAARTARRLDDNDEAKRLLDRAAQLGWVKEAIDLERALAQAQRGDLNPIEGVLVSFVGRDHPDKTLILEALSRGYLATYRLHRALACLDSWLELQPDNTQALLWRGQTRLLLDRRDDALADYRRVIEADLDDEEGCRKLAELLLSSHQADQALPYFVRWRQRQPNDPEALLGLAQCQAELAQTDEAIALLDRLLSTDPRHAAALALRGKLALDAGRTNEAESWLRKSLALAPRERAAVYSLYRCLQAQDRQDEARRWQATLENIDADLARLDRLKKEIQKSPNDASLRCEMGRILLRNHQEREALRWLESALKENPHHAAAHAALADYYQQVGDVNRTAYHRRQAAAQPAADTAARRNK
jgi:tetratricopeptide (TPR) repeat protein